MQDTNTSRHTWIDGLRLCAGVSMVGLHATSNSAGLPFPEATAAERIAPMLLRAVLYMARTELFLLISVFLLLLSLDRRPRGYRATMAQQARRLLPPFVFWTLFYAIYNLLKAGAFNYHPQALTQLTDPVAWAGFLLLGDVKYHMHFIPTLLGFLLLYPLVLAAVTRPWMGLLVVFGLLAKWHLDAWAYSTLWDSPSLPYVLRAIKILSYSGYGFAAAALAGLWLRHGSKLAKQTLWPLLTICIVFALVLLGLKLQAMVIVIQTGAWAYGNEPGYWADFLMPLVLMSLTMLLCGRNWPEKLSVWAPYSFGIYLCHPTFLDLAEICIPASWSPTQHVAAKIAFTLPMTICLIRTIARSRHLGWTIGLGPLPQFTVPKRQSLRP
ncbi:MAG: acyltransferase [Pseudomonadota bacterium]|nr:acyltransferase [Pseudomonadota bacterium]